MSRDFSVETKTASAVSLHAFDPPDRPQPTLVVAEVRDAALVLGSAQRDSVIDQARVNNGDYAVVRRRSGGGSVWLSPGDQVWVDVWIPAGHRLWNDDVVRAALPIGEAWSQALQATGFASLEVHDGGVEATTWSSLVCFAGRGPGEVIDTAGRKWVGLSQRRTREWIRLQTMTHRVWDPARAVDGLRLSPHEREQVANELADAVGTVGSADVLPRLVDALG